MVHGGSIHPRDHSRFHIPHFVWLIMPSWRPSNMMDQTLMTVHIIQYFVREFSMFHVSIDRQHQYLHNNSLQMVDLFSSHRRKKRMVKMLAWQKVTRHTELMYQTTLLQTNKREREKTKNTASQKKRTICHCHPISRIIIGE